MPDNSLELQNLILTFYPRTTLQEPQPAKDIPEICNGILTPESVKRVENYFRNIYENPELLEETNRMSKPRVRIYDWAVIGEQLMGKVIDHPRFEKDTPVHTSKIIKIETRNTIYVLEESPPKEPKNAKE